MDPRRILDMPKSLQEGGKKKEPIFEKLMSKFTARILQAKEEHFMEELE